MFLTPRWGAGTCARIQCIELSHLHGKLGCAHLPGKLGFFVYSFRMQAYIKLDRCRNCRLCFCLSVNIILIT